MDKLLLRPEETAEALAVGRDRIYELIGSGRLRSVKLGRSRRIPRDRARSLRPGAEPRWFPPC